MSLPAFHTPPKLRERYAQLMAEQISEQPDGSLALGEGRLWRREGVHVLHVHGDRFEMAYQHGRLLRDEIADGALVAASKVAEHGVHNSVGDGVMGKAINLFARHRIRNRMLRHAVSHAPDDPDAHLAEAYGLSEGSGVGVETIIAAALGPESAQVLFGMTDKGAGIGTSLNHCSSFAAWGEQTRDGDMVIGRNTDYPLTGYFDRHPTVIYFHPTDGSHRMMTVTSAGFHNAGVCGLNEHGIYLAVHTVVTRHVGGEGMPIFMTGQQVLREASTFDEAVEMLQKFRPAAGWSYHLVSTRERRAATIEMANDAVAVRPCTAEAHVTTNHWSHPDMVDRFLELNRTVHDDSHGRKARITELLEQRRGVLDEEGAIGILADRFDPVMGCVRTYPNTISAHYTVSSMVWRPDQGRMWVANGTAPVPNNAYVCFPTIDQFDPERFASWQSETIDSGSFGREHPDKAKAEQIFLEAKAAFEYDNDLERALSLMGRVLEVDDDNPAFHYVLALLAVKQGQFHQARDAAERVVQIGTDGPRVPLAQYLLARIAAHHGQRDEARRLLAAVIAHPDASERLRRAAQTIDVAVGRWSRVRFASNDIAFMGFLPDAYRYVGILRSMLQSSGPVTPPRAEALRSIPG